jgi:hypothetical protein
VMIHEVQQQSDAYCKEYCRLKHWWRTRGAVLMESKDCERLKRPCRWSSWSCGRWSCRKYSMWIIIPLQYQELFLFSFAVAAAVLLSTAANIQLHADKSLPVVFH